MNRLPLLFLMSLLYILPISRSFIQRLNSGNYRRKSFATTYAGNNLGTNLFDDYRSDFEFVSGTQWSQLESLTKLLVEWNSKVNLISRQDIPNIVSRHIIPSMAVAKWKRFAENKKIIDIGTGGGLPGLPMAILNPTCDFTLLDSNGKKIAVVSDISERIGLTNVHTVHDRAENHKDVYDYMLGRAVSNLPNFLSFSCHFMSSVNEDGGLLYLKGGDFSDELKDARIVDYTLINIEDIAHSIESDKKVLWIPYSNISKFKSYKNEIEDMLQKRRKESKRKKQDQCE